MQTQLFTITSDILKRKYPQAKAIFLAGSVVRGEGTSTSDLDLVVLFEKLDCAYRESFIFEGWPVEAFVHDPKTLEYFFYKIDGPTGFPSLASMVSEGVVVPEADNLTDSVKALANSIIDDGPPKWSREEVDNSRYLITDLIDDIRDPRTNQEMIATATQLYPALANHYFRSKNIWSAKGKTIPRRLHQVDAAFARKFLECFDEIFISRNTTKVIELSVKVLESEGGYLFEGHRLEAPKSWRME